MALSLFQVATLTNYFHIQLNYFFSTAGLHYASCKDHLLCLIFETLSDILIEIFLLLSDDFKYNYSSLILYLVYFVSFVVLEQQLNLGITSRIQHG